MPTPEIVCLCGSTRFYEQFMEANYRETLQGHIVLSVGFFMHQPDATKDPRPPISREQKAMLDDLHLAKIDLADRILVINVGGYVGLSTRREIWYALKHGKTISWWDPEQHKPTQLIESWFPTYRDWLAAGLEASETTPS